MAFKYRLISTALTKALSNTPLVFRDNNVNPSCLPHKLYYKSLKQFQFNYSLATGRKKYTDSVTKGSWTEECIFFLQRK